MSRKKSILKDLQYSDVGKFFQRSHIYTSLSETILKAFLLSFTTGATMLCYFGTTQEPKVIGGATFLYILSVISEIAPKSKYLTNLLNRFYIFIIILWGFAMLMVSSSLIFFQNDSGRKPAEMNFNNLLIIISLVPVLVYVLDTFVYFLFGPDESDSTLGYILSEINFREMRNV